MKAQDLHMALSCAAEITELHLSATQAGTLSTALEQLVNLRRMSLVGCGLRHLPGSIARCTLLDNLVLDRNKLETLPDELGHCHRLFRLSVARNRLSALPDSLTQCLNLRQLDLSHNRITAWPEVVEKLPWLAKLDLSYNSMVQLPDSPKGLAQLSVLNLSCNAIETLPEQALFPRLETLVLKGNRISTLPESWRRLPALEKMDISGNPIRELPQLPAGLKSLDITGCPMNGLPPVLLQLDQLRELKGVQPTLRKKLLSFLGACRKKSLPVNLRSKLFAAYCGVTGALQDLTQEECLNGLTLSLPVLREYILRHLTRAEAPLQGASIAFWGKPSVANAIWKPRLEAAGLMIAPIREAQWIAIGRPPYSAPVNIREDAVFIREHTLVHATSNEASGHGNRARQLGRLLTVPGAGNAALAVSIIKGAGLPPELLTELLYAWMQAPAGMVKKQLYELLIIHTPPESRQLLRKPIKALLAQSPEKTAAIVNISLQGTVFDPVKLIRLLKSGDSPEAQ